MLSREGSCIFGFEVKQSRAGFETTKLYWKVLWWKSLCDGINIFRKSGDHAEICEAFPSMGIRTLRYWLEARPGCRCLPTIGLKILWVLVRDQAIVLVEVVTLHTHVFISWSGYFETGDGKLGSICAKSGYASWYALENYGLSFISCLREKYKWTKK